MASTVIIRSLLFLSIVIFKSSCFMVTLPQKCGIPNAIADRLVLRSFSQHSARCCPHVILPRLRQPLFMAESSAFAESEPNAALIAAAEKGDSSTIEQLISAGAAVDFQHEDDHLKAAGYSSEDTKGPSALATSAMFGKINAVQTLIRLGANVNLATSEGMTALHFAVIGGHGNIVRVLLDAGADPTLQNEFGDTPQAMAQDAPNNLQELFLLRK